MKRLSMVLSALIWGLVLTESLCAQQALNRVEQFLRDQSDAVKSRAGKVPKNAEPGYLGVIADDRQEGGRGVLIVNVVAEGPAAQAGLQNGDLIIAIDGQRVGTMKDMGYALRGKPAGAKATFTVNREEKEEEVIVTLGNRPQSTPIGKIPHELPEPHPAGAALLPPGPRLGVRTLPVNEDARLRNKIPNLRGALVISVAKGSPAAQADIPLGAVITGLNDLKIASPQELAVAIHESGGGEVELTYLFQGEETTVSVQLDAQDSLPPPDDSPKLQLGAPPAEVPPTEFPAEAPAPEASDDPRIATLEARIEELEARIEKLEAALKTNSE